MAPSASANIPVFEAYAGPRPKKVDAATMVLTELGKLPLGFVTSARTLQSSLGIHLPLPGSDPTLTVAEFTKQLDLADAAWMRQPALDELVATLTGAVETAKGNPAFLVIDPSRREVFRRVLLAYAITLARSGDPRASERAMAEWIRTFPDQVVTRSHDGSDAELLYVETRKALAKLGRGTLTVNVDATLKLYVNEVIRRPGLPIADLLPGIYRVLALDRYNRSRRYTVEVLANQDSVLAIDWPVDSALKITSTYAAFEFPTTQELAQSGQAIGRFVEAALGAPGVILVKVSRGERGQMTATAELYSAKQATAVRSASVELAEGARDNADRITALARFIGLGEVSPKITVNAAELVRANQPTPHETLSPSTSTASTSFPTTSQAPPTRSKGLLSSHPHWFQTVLIAGGLAMAAWGVHLQDISTKKEEGPNGPVTVPGGISKSGIALALLGTIPATIGVCWVIDEHWPPASGGSQPGQAKAGAALRLVPVDGGGTVAVAGWF
jgi:archaellin